VEQHRSPGKEVTPTDRLSGFGTGLATNSDSVERVPRGHVSRYSDPNSSAMHLFFVAWLASLVPVRYFLCAWHTDQLKRMVATADRSPARYIFELKLAEVPSGPLRS
jgi:hypothetical protein